MTVSVIIPTLNEERALPGTLARTRELGIHEIIVVDGGSHDRTRDIAQSFRSDVRRSTFDVPASSHEPRTPSTSNSEPCPPLVTMMTSPPGRALQMNAGAAVSRGDVLLFLHADTLLPLDARTAIEGALASPHCVGGRFDVRFEPDAGLGWLIARMMSLRSRWSGIATGDQAIFLRRTVFERLGGFADIPLMEDVELSRRLKHVGRVVPLRSSVTTSYRRWKACGPLRTILLMWGLRLLYWIGVSPHALRHLYAAVR